MAKLTNAQLISRVALLESEILRLKDEKAQENKLAKETTGCDTWAFAYHKVAQELINLKDQDTTENTQTPKIVKVEATKVVGAMKWLLGHLGIEGSYTEEFLGSFTMYTNANKSRLMIEPKKGANVGNFMAVLNRARFNKGIKGNWWHNTGMWLDIPVKK